MIIDIDGYEHTNIVKDFIVFICEMFDIKPSSITLTVNDSMEYNGLCVDVTETDFLIIVKNVEEKMKIYFRQLRTR